MTGDLYWVSSLTYAFVISIILINEYRANHNPNKVEIAYRRMAICVGLFCIQDVMWGLCDNGVIRNDGVFFISSAVFHTSTVITTFFWLYYVLIYLDEDKKKLDIFLKLDVLIVILEFGLILCNFFKPIVFSIKDGVYITEKWRPLAFFNQYIVYFITGFATLIHLINSDKAHRKRLLTVFLISLSPILLGVFQYLYPNAPFYSLGYFLTCFVIHIFVVAKDREDADRLGIMKAIEGSYYTMHLIDLVNNKVVRYIEPDHVKNALRGRILPGQMLKLVVDTVVSDDFKDDMDDFFNLDTLPERMNGDKRISKEFVGRNYGWVRITFIPLERENNALTKVMIISEIIDKEKRKQMDLIFQSTCDELTGLDNRRAFEKDIEAYKKKDLEKDLVFISLDVNELKHVNDTLGHEAGDELLKGAAYCMKKSFSPYGKIYRTGGDEFNAIIFANKNMINSIMCNFNENVVNWTGSIVKNIAIAAGYVTYDDVEVKAISEMAILADKRMYEEKTLYYRKKGIDRKGLNEAHVALVRLYSKVLKFNIDEDSFSVINIERIEENERYAHSEKFSDWLNNSLNAGLVYKDDEDSFKASMNYDYIREYFKAGKDKLSVFYRRNCDGVFKQYLLEIVKSCEYSENYHSFYLFAKQIEKQQSE